MFICIECEQSPNIEIVIEETEKFAYAYLKINKLIVADVWLYNCRYSPDTPEWKNRNLAPFANPKEYSKESETERINNETDVSVKWIIENNNVTEAQIFKCNKLFAILKPSSKPGWCSNAAKDGPLERVLWADFA